MHLRHLRMLQNALLDLARLDAKTADLHLTVNPPQVLDQPVGIDPHLIAGSVMQHVPGIACRQAQETLCGLCRTVAITACDPAAAQVKLTRLATGNRALLRIKHLHAGVRQWPTDRHRVPGKVAGDRIAHSEGGAFGGSVGVENPATAVGIGLIPGTHRCGADLLTADQHLAQAGETGGVIRTQGVEQRHGHEQAVDLLRFQHPGQLLCVLQVCVGNDDAATAVEQRCPQLEVTGVERRVGQTGNTLACANVEAAVGPGQTQKTTLAHLHGFRGAGGARGVEQKARLGEVLGQRQCWLIGVLQQGFDADVPATLWRCQAVRVFTKGHQPDTASIVEHQLSTPGRAGPIQRHHHSPDFQHGQYRGDPLPAARHAQGNRISRACALCQQPFGDALTGTGQLRVGQPYLPVDHRQRLGIKTYLLGKT